MTLSPELRVIADALCRVCMRELLREVRGSGGQETSESAAHKEGDCEQRERTDARDDRPSET